MKTFLVVLAIIGTVVADEWAPKTTNEEFKDIRKKCLASNPLPKEELEALDKLVYLDEEPVRKYLLCFTMALGLYNEQDGFIIERIVTQFRNDTEESEATVIVKRCFGNTDEKISTDVRMYRGYKCMLGSKLGAAIRAHIEEGKHKMVAFA